MAACQCATRLAMISAWCSPPITMMAKGGLRPYQTLIDEVPTGAYFTGTRFGAPLPSGPLRNSDTTVDPYDNATGSPEVNEVTNEATGCLPDG